MKFVRAVCSCSCGNLLKVTGANFLQSRKILQQTNCTRMERVRNRLQKIQLEITNYIAVSNRRSLNVLISTEIWSCCQLAVSRNPSFLFLYGTFSSGTRKVKHPVFVFVTPHNLKINIQSIDTGFTARGTDRVNSVMKTYCSFKVLQINWFTEFLVEPTFEIKAKPSLFLERAIARG